MTPSAVAFSRISWTTLTMFVDRLRGKEVVERLDEVARLLGAAGAAEHGEREEDQRDRGEQAEVGDHRGEVRPAVGEELGERLRERAVHAGSIVSARGCRVRPRRSDRDLLADRGRRRSRRDGSRARVDARERGRDRTARTGRRCALRGGDVPFRVERRARSRSWRPLSVTAASSSSRRRELGIVARTGAGPSSGLVFYDLRTCLRAAAEAEPRKRKPRSRAAKKTETADA